MASDVPIGVIDASPEAESRRNIVVTPFWDRDDGTADLATRLAAILARDDAPQTPGKFGYAIDSGAAPVLTGTSADIRIERGAEGGLIVRPDGSDHGAPATPETAPALALDLASAGADVAVHCRSSREEAEEVARAIRAMGRRSVVVACDLVQPDETTAAFARAHDALGRLDILVNNVGTIVWKRFDELTPEDRTKIDRIVRALRSDGGC